MLTLRLRLLPWQKARQCTFQTFFYIIYVHLQLSCNSPFCTLKNTLYILQCTVTGDQLTALCDVPWHDSSSADHVLPGRQLAQALSLAVLQHELLLPRTLALETSSLTCVALQCSTARSRSWLHRRSTNSSTDRFFPGNSLLSISRPAVLTAVSVSASSLALTLRKQ